MGKNKVIYMRCTFAFHCNSNLYELLKWYLSRSKRINIEKYGERSAYLHSLVLHVYALFTLWRTTFSIDGTTVRSAGDVDS